ncbi:MAG TPA: cob(I)yrinic acid a,c-diamide adenosyltransferase [Chitinophagales bacterium]|jgi:cob(I)alamin adenosyltransferase|nr:cob(I)yrinic acid a,c-diamide adenosyltransferase [Chitinophagales bacterium]HPW86387.1 cob(I)yrinic acid a,c-diamide adenosyltransferase [Chitinophagales bacterium]HQO32333.1 cob(I)yrinic acid a,c-diamide adenosyltransferase [Chitinophagales bacterium]HQO89218.1 cob(I)yrinic acid a,c-diamide adenosyltransferase [Chitinophagales bacterium]
MKIYTKTGDAGTTALYGGKRLSKGDWRIEAYGTVDELNSNIGLVATYLEEKEFTDLMVDIQSRLFDAGTHLAAEPGKANLILPELPEEKITQLETFIDKMNETLPELKYFILPGGNRAAATAHIARTVCRRAERAVVRLNEEEPVHPWLIQYLNRLSDFLFVLARKLAHDAGTPEVIWKAH